LVPGDKGVTSGMKNSIKGGDVEEYKGAEKRKNEIVWRKRCHRSPKPVRSRIIQRYIVIFTDEIGEAEARILDTRVRNY